MGARPGPGVSHTVANNYHRVTTPMRGLTAIHPYAKRSLANSMR
jgi:hypothetical protein